MARIVVHDGERVTAVEAKPGISLRQALLDANLTPYAWATRQLNCRGRGLCATCGVWIEEEPTPTHWHDKLAQRYGYPRLSCQIEVEEGMVVHLIPEKKVWGSRRTD